MASFVFILAALVVAGALAFPQTEVDELFHLRRRAVNCEGNPSSLVEGCMRSLMFMEHMSSGMPLEKVDTPEELNTVCLALNNATRCVGRVHNECHKREDMMTAMVYEIMEGVVGHICSPEGKEVVLAESDCWENKALKRDVEDCANNQQNNRDICSALNALKRCIEGAVRDRCSDRAARFMGELIYEAMQPIASRLSMLVPGGVDCNIQMRVARSLLNALPITRK